MTPTQLKNSILQLAIQGKLVEQREEEGTAEQLFKKIQEEKQKLIEEKKIKKEKPLPEITEEEKPFDIPSSWKWVRLQQISSLVTKGTTPKGGDKKYSNNGIGFLRAENIGGFDKINKTNLKYIDEKIHTEELKRSIIKENDMLITIAGTLGRTAIVKDIDLPLNSNQAICIVRLANIETINLFYLIYVINSYKIQKYLTSQKKITAIPNLTLEIIQNCIIPLPPLEEQKRIVEKLEQILPYIEQYEKAWNELETLNKDFPDKLKKSLLQYAIEGKLVEQREEEGTAEQLFKKIQEEKQKLIEEKKIKKEKTLPEITEDEKPFDIPSNWKWFRLNNICCLLDGKKISNNLYPYLEVKYLRGKIEATMRSNGKFISKGTNVILVDGENSGEVFNIKEDGYMGSTFKELFILNSIHIPYILKFLELKRFEFKNNKKGSAIPHLDKDLFFSMLIPLPPLKEQKRIVEKLEQLIPLCEKLNQQNK